MNYTIKFGQFVQKRRIELGITQKELSNKIYQNDKQNIRFISHLERGKIENMTLATAERILEVLNAEMEFKSRE